MHVQGSITQYLACNFGAPPNSVLASYTLDSRVIFEDCTYCLPVLGLEEEGLAAASSDPSGLV